MLDISNFGAWSVLNQGDFEEPAEAHGERVTEGAVSFLRLSVRRAKGGIYGWVSPTTGAQAGQYHRFSCKLRGDTSGYWEAQSYADEAAQPEDFHTTSLPANSRDWTDFVYYFRAKPLRSRMRLLVWPAGTGRLELAEPELRPATKAEVWDWFSAIAASIPRRFPDDEPDCGRLMPRTLAKLRGGAASGPVRILIFGDSIAYDVANMPLDVALERAYPGASVEIHTRGWGSAGWAAWSAPGVLERLALPVRPDLVIAMGISTRAPDIAPCLGGIVDTLRDACGSEFALMTNHLARATRSDQEPAREAEEARRLARARGCELIDLRRFVEGYLSMNELPPLYLSRDTGIHFSERGRAAVLHLMLGHLAPGITAA